MTNDISENAKAVVRRNTIEVQGGGNWELFNELFADDFHDHTPQPGGERIDLPREYGFQHFGNHGNAPGMTRSHFR